MDMTFSAADLAFRDEVRAFLDAKLNARLREGAANTPSVFTEPDITREWQAILHEQGWLATARGLRIPRSTCSRRNVRLLGHRLCQSWGSSWSGR
jgi:hypothetical protein